MADKLDVPIWAIIGDENLNDLAAVVANMRVDIKEIEEMAIKKESDLEALNSRLNMYVKTILQIEEYDNSKDLLIINEKNEACIYYETTLNEDVDFNNLPEPSEKHKITHKQSQKIIESMEKYTEILIDYEDLLDEYDELVATHDEIWDQIHESLADTTFLQVHDSKKEEETNVELFNKKKHTLFVIKEESGLWGFKYIRKKDEKKFYKYIDSQKKGEEA